MFNKNLEFVDNISLKRRLERLTALESRIGISYCVTPSNDYVLLKNDLPTEDLQNPREAVKKFLKANIKQEMCPNDIIINFGIGLGYLLDETFNNYPSKIFIYEPDLHLLHFVLSNVDISEHLSSGRVYITNDLDELINKLGSTFLTKDKVEIVYLQNYAITKNKELLLLTQKVFDVCKSKMVDINTITRFSKKWLLNTIDNISSINKGNAFLLSDLENNYSGKVALITGAGPSLADNIENIKSNRDKFIIFALNKNATYLYQQGVSPDFIVCLDAENMDRTLSGLDCYLQNTSAIIDIRTDSSIFSKKFKHFFVNFSETDFFIKKVSKYNPFIKFYEAGGTASTLALTAAVKMGFSKIVMAGVDLAFKNNVIYSNGATMQRLSQDEIIVDNIHKKLVMVKSVKGTPVHTREDYQAFIHHFESLIKELDYSEVYNLTSFGAYIEGVKSTSFEKLNLSSYTVNTSQLTTKPFKFMLEDFIKDEFRSINEIISMLSKGSFSSQFVSTIVKSNFIYQYMQSDVLTVLQKNFDVELAQNFIDNTKIAIKTVVEQLQKNKLV